MPDLYGQLTPQGVLNGSLQTIMHADNYNDLINKPSINSVELQGNKTAADLGLLTAGDIPVDSVNGKQGVVILDGDDIEYEAGTSVNSKITDLEAEIGSGPVISVNGQQGVVELDGTDINYSLTKTLNQKIDEVAASIPVVLYPVTSVNTKTGDVVLDGDDIEYAEGVTVNDQIGTNAANIGDLTTITTSDKSSLVGAVNEVNAVTDYINDLSYHSGVTRYLGGVYKQGKIVICNLTLKIEQNINNNEIMVSGLPILAYRAIRFPCMVGTDPYLIGNSDGAIYMKANTTELIRWGNLTATSADPKYMTMMFVYMTA
jgi:hypothetical protein